jgi:hypothetical protein
MSISQFFADYWMVLVGVLLGGLYMARRFIRTGAGRMMADRTILRLPLIGDVARMVSISRLTSTLATMLTSGVQLLDAMDVSKRVMNNRVLEETVEAARQNIREGETIADPLKRSGEFPALVTHMIAVGEKSGEMDGGDVAPSESNLRRRSGTGHRPLDLAHGAGHDPGHGRRRPLHCRGDSLAHLRNGSDGPLKQSSVKGDE